MRQDSLRTFLLGLGCLLGVVGAASAQTVEISPYGAWRWGGELEAEDADLFARDADVDEGFAGGLRLGFAVSRSFQIELLASRQDTEFVIDADLFGGDEVLADVELDYYHVGALWQAGSGQARPYFVVSAGATRIAPDLAGVSAEERFSLGLGGGVKVFVNPHLGFRFEARGFWTDTEEDDDWDDDDWDCCDRGGDEGLVQGEVSTGLVVAF